MKWNFFALLTNLFCQLAVSSVASQLISQENGVLYFRELTHFKNIFSWHLRMRTLHTFWIQRQEKLTRITLWHTVLKENCWMLRCLMSNVKHTALSLSTLVKETSARRKKMKKENSDINRRERMLRRQASFVQPPPDSQTVGSTCDRWDCEAKNLLQNCALCLFCNIAVIAETNNYSQCETAVY